MGKRVEFKNESGSGSGYLAGTEQGEGPGVLLLHAWWGMTDFFTQLADRLAGEGFIVLVPDLYGGRTTASIEEAEQLVNKLNSSEAIKTVTAALDYLLDQQEVRVGLDGVVGFSLGAAYATWLAAIRPEIAAAVLFYGGVEQEPDYAEHTDAAFLVHMAENDPYESLEQAQVFERTMTAAGKEVEFYVYPGTGHWFFESNRPDAYNAEASALAWERTVKFLHARLG